MNRATKNLAWLLFLETIFSCSAVSRERLRIAFEPTSLTVGDTVLKRVEHLQQLDRQDGFYFADSGPVPGWLEIRHSKRGQIMIRK